MKKNITLDLLKSRSFDFTKIPPKDHKLITIQDNTILSRGNFMLISGLPKVSKSLFVSLFISSALADLNLYGIKAKRYPDKDRIALFDTEQGNSDLYNSINRSFNIIENETGIEKKKLYFSLKSKLDVFSMREDDPNVILEMLEVYLQNNTTCGIIFIDGLLDLVYNFNDERECKTLINFFKRITKQYKIGIVCVLHTAKTTGFTIGHIGSFADRYCQSNLEVIKTEDNIIVMQGKLLRSSGDFTPICLQRGNNNEILEVESFVPQKKR